MKRDLDGTGLECGLARVQASAWIDDELPASQALEAHLEDCGGCRAHVEELRSLRARLEPLRAEGPVSDLWPAIAARAAVSRPASTGWNFRGRRVAAGLIGCAGTAALLYAASQFENARRNGSVQSRAHWPAALHGETLVDRGWLQSPEQMLLASLERARESNGPGGRR